MAKEQTLQDIYVELDVILDTRLGTLAKMGDSIAEKILFGGYHTRDTDIFPSVDMNLYKELYQKRDKETLKKSLLTGAFPMLDELASKIVKQSKSRPYQEGVRITINVYPYQLSTKEIEAIVGAVAFKLNFLADIKVVYFPLSEITPKHCKERYSVLMMYDFGTWSNLHYKAFEKIVLPEVLLLGPAIYEKKPTEAELAQAIREAAHPMQAIEMMFSPLIELRLIDIKFFSIVAK